MFFLNLKIKTKIALGFSILLIFVILAGLTGVVGTQNIAKSFDGFLAHNTLAVRTALEIKNSSTRIALLLMQFEQTSMETDQATKEGMKNALLAEFEKMDYWKNVYPNKDELVTLSDAQEQVVSIALDISGLREYGVPVSTLREKTMALEQKRSELDAAIQVVLDKEIASTERIRVQSERSILLTEKIVLLVSFLALLVGMFAALRITRSIYEPLNELSAAVRRYTLGKFTERVLVPSDDQIGVLAKNFNTMADRLQETYGRLDEKTKSLQDNIHATLEQNKNLEKTKVAMISLLEDAKLLEDSLRQERDRVKAIITSMIEGLVVVDERNAIVMLNPAAANFLGVNASDVVGRDIRDVIPLYKGDELLSASEYPMVQVLANRLTLAIDLEDDINFRKGRNTKEIPVAMTMSTLASGDTMMGGICIFRDITILKQLDEAKVNFISIASHQLRTPLTSMRWFSEMLLDGEAGALNEEQKHFVERVYQGTDRMISLVNLLLQIARVEAGRLRVEPKPLDLVAMTRGVLLTIKAGLDAKKQVVNIVTHPEVLPAIPMDQEVIWQVIQNLLTNANRYSLEGGTITVTITQKDHVIEYAVKDNGIGIPSDQVAKLFEKFFRADNALQMVPEGSGLGLSLVKSLVEGWGGKIWFESEVNKGTTFYFTIGINGMKEKTGAVGLVV
jgi:two-component system phosphate regulon sensor histidine kinase PhoR